MKTLNAKPDFFKPDYGLENAGISTGKTVYWNYSTPALYQESLSRGESNVVYGGPLCVSTGKHTGRSPNDRYFVETKDIEGKLFYNKSNKGIKPEYFDKIFAKVKEYVKDKDLFVRDAYVGSSEASRLKVRAITECAWTNLFVKNMFIEPKQEELKAFVPEFTLICLPKMKVDPATDGTVSETAILINFEKKMILVIGSEYGGENKKALFTVMNFLLPQKGIMTMHCSANVGDKQDSAIFFGLSGTGKTTLSADITRAQIYSTTHRFGTVLENVVFDPETGKLNLDDDTLTENTRACYPLNFIENAVESKRATHPKNIIFLTCDAFGVMPPISKLTPDQALYHFISGYTAKVAGTEKGVKEPTSTFSTCFGGPFMPLHPSVYAELLKKKIKEHNVDCWLVNTGWIGGPYGVGHRISIKYTRALLNAALDGKLAKVDFITDPVFGFQIPQSCEGVPSEILNPMNSWANKEEYMVKYESLAKSFIENFKKYEDGCSKEVLAAAPKVK